MNDADISGKVWYKQLQSKIEEDDIILKVYALTAPPSLGPEVSRRVLIGRIKLLSDLYTSDFGDRSLFFRHRRAEDADRPWWPEEWK